MRLSLPAIASAEDYRRHFHDDVWQEAAALICERHRLPDGNLRRSTHGENIIFFVGDAFIIKIYTPFREGFAREKAALEFAHGKLGIETPEIVCAGDLEGLSYLVMTQLAGSPLRDVWASVEARGRIEIVSRLGLALSKLHAHAAPLSEAALNRDWDGFVRRQAHTSVERQRSCDANPEWLESLPAYIAARLALLPLKDKLVMLHGDVHPGNLLLAEKGGRWQITGLFDFADSLCGFHEYEFVAPGVLMVQGNRELQRALLLAYGYEEAQLDLSLRARLMLLTILYECSDLRKYALRLAPEAVHLTLDELEAAIWTFAAG
jgi:Ser/Thr protein kinase RdoA (MazF antagonist)